MSSFTAEFISPEQIYVICSAQSLATSGNVSKVDTSGYGLKGFGILSLARCFSGLFLSLGISGKTFAVLEASFAPIHSFLGNAPIVRLLCGSHLGCRGKCCDLEASVDFYSLAEIAFVCDWPVLCETSYVGWSDAHADRRRLDGSQIVGSLDSGASVNYALRYARAVRLEWKMTLCAHRCVQACQRPFACASGQTLFPTAL